MSELLINLFLVVYVGFALAEGSPAALVTRYLPGVSRFVLVSLGVQNRWTHFSNVSRRMAPRLLVFARLYDGTSVPIPLRRNVTGFHLIDRLASHKIAKFEVALLKHTTPAVCAGVARYALGSVPLPERSLVRAIELKRVIVTVPPMADAGAGITVTLEDVFTQSAVEIVANGGFMAT